MKLNFLVFIGMFIYLITMVPANLVTDEFEDAIGRGQGNKSHRAARGVDQSTRSLCQGEINYARGGRATASSEFSAVETAAAAFDGHEKDRYEWHSKDGMPQWLQYELVDPVAICGISFLPRLDNSLGNVKRDCPKSYKFQGSNDGLTFETLLFVKNQVCVPGATISKSFNNINAYKFYRFLVLEVPGRTYGQHYAVMRELRFFGNDRAIGVVTNTNTDCWGPCNGKGGDCAYCGSGGACCRQGWTDGSGCNGGNGCNYHCCVTVVRTGSDPWVTGSCSSSAPQNPNSCDGLNVDLCKSCGKRVFHQAFAKNSGFSRIVGGTAVAKGTIPWQVSIWIGGKHWCGGTIIDANHIVSAAHCFRTTNPSRCTVVVGESSLSQNECTEQRLGVASIKNHERYNNNNYQNDIAILKTTDSIQFNNFVQPACLPSSDFSYRSGQQTVVSGWGDLRELGESADILNAVTVPLISQSECRQLNANFKPISSEMFCAGYRNGGIDACQGDSGGPLVTLVDGHYTLIGITSFGLGCARSQYPGVYTRVTHYLRWIRENK